MLVLFVAAITCYHSGFGCRHILTAMKYVIGLSLLSLSTNAVVRENNEPFLAPYGQGKVKMALRKL